MTWSSQGIVISRHLPTNRNVYATSLCADSVKRNSQQNIQGLKLDKGKIKIVHLIKRNQNHKLDVTLGEKV